MSEVEVTVGRVGRPHGLRGEVFVNVRTDEPDRRFRVGARLLTSSGGLTVRSVRWHSGRLVALFEGVDDRDAAAGLRGQELRSRVAADERPDDPDEYYDHQLRGLRVAGADGAVLGIVRDVLHLPSQDLLAVDADGREVLVPFVADLVPSVDLTAGLVTVVDIPGLLTDAETDADRPAAEPG